MLIVTIYNINGGLSVLLKINSKTKNKKSIVKITVETRGISLKVFEIIF